MAVKIYVSRDAYNKNKLTVYLYGTGTTVLPSNITKIRWSYRKSIQAGSDGVIFQSPSEGNDYITVFENRSYAHTFTISEIGYTYVIDALYFTEDSSTGKTVEETTIKIDGLGNIQKSGTTTSSFSFYLTSCSKSFDPIYVHYRKSGDTLFEQMTWSGIEYNGSQSSVYTIDGLEENTTYEVYLICYYDGENQGAIPSEAWEGCREFTTNGDSGGGNGGGNGDGGDGMWSLITHDSRDNIGSGTAYIPFNVSQLQVHMFPVKFARNGIATIYTDSSLDTLGYLGTSDVFDSDEGRPEDYDIVDDDEGYVLNFKISHEVKSVEQYYIWVRLSEGKAGDATLYIEFEPGSSDNTIQKWDWEKSNGSATRAQTYTAYEAATNKLRIDNFSYLVWNDLCEKVMKIIDAAGGSWYDNYATYANTKMSSAEKEITATKFNSLRFNIGSRYSTGINEVKPRDEVLGEYFITLAERINCWIDTL